jgi:23S rRNA G2069 N7-methylase RlmK/C1962 C5-methylase RlmI
VHTRAVSLKFDIIDSQLIYADTFEKWAHLQMLQAGVEIEREELQRKGQEIVRQFESDYAATFQMYPA